MNFLRKQLTLACVQLPPNSLKGNGLARNLQGSILAEIPPRAACCFVCSRGSVQTVRGQRWIATSQTLSRVLVEFSRMQEGDKCSEDECSSPEILVDGRFEKLLNTKQHSMLTNTENEGTHADAHGSKGILGSEVCLSKSIGPSFKQEFGTRLEERSSLEADMSRRSTSICCDGPMRDPTTTREYTTGKESDPDSEFSTGSLQAKAVRAELVLSVEQETAVANQEAAAAAQEYAAAAARREAFRRLGRGARLKEQLQRSFEFLLPLHVKNVTCSPRALEEQHCDGATVSVDNAPWCTMKEIKYETEDGTDGWTPAQRFYLENKDLLLQQAQHYVERKQRESEANSTEYSDVDAAAVTLQQDWEAYHNPVVKQAKGFRWCTGALSKPLSAAHEANPCAKDSGTFRKGCFPTHAELRALLEQERITNIEYVDLVHFKREDLGKLAVVGTGTNARHCRKVSRMLRSLIASLEIPEVSALCLGSSGSEKRCSSRFADNPEWYVVILGPVSVHLMTEEARRHYNLEGLWSCTFHAVQGGDEASGATVTQTFLNAYLVNHGAPQHCMASDCRNVAGTVRVSVLTDGTCS